MKKTLFALFIVLLMFWGNMEVFANTTNSTQESDGGGTSSSSNSETEEKKEKMCTYDFGDYQIQIRYKDGAITSNDLIDTKTENKAELKFENRITNDEWIKYASKSETGCPYSVTVGRIYLPLDEWYDKHPECNRNGTSSVAHCNNPYELIGFYMTYESPSTNGESTVFCSNCDDVDFDFIYGNTEFDCKSLIGDDMVALINSGMNIIKIIVPIIVIGLGIFDIAKAVFASNDDDIKKAQKTFFKRLIIAVIIFFSPILVNFVIDITNEAAGFVNSDTCGIK